MCSNTAQSPLLTLSQLAMFCDGTLYGADAAVKGATQDSRKVGAGQLFVALPGLQQDGHDFVALAAQADAAAALVARRVDVDLPQIVVADVELALQQAAKLWRQQLDVSVIAITGSCGKTTVKQMLAAILTQQAPTLATAGNLNNQLGVPLTLLGLSHEHRYAVIEMGASQAGDISLLCDIAAPDVALITVVAEAHLEGFGSLQGVASAKGEIYAGLTVNGCAIMNSAEPWIGQWQQQHRGNKTLSFGADALADVSVSQQHCQAWLDEAQAGSSFSLNLPDGAVEVKLPLPGWHNVLNAAAAAAAAIAVDIPADLIKSGLEIASNVAGRLSIQRLSNGALLVDDSYNANPTSIQAAAQWLVASNIAGQKILVLGEMAELGESSEAIHQQLGSDLKALGLTQLCCLGGAAAKAMTVGFGDGSNLYTQRQDLVSYLAANLVAEDAVLVKGSRSAAMEQVVSALNKSLDGQVALHSLDIPGA